MAEKANWMVVAAVALSVGAGVVVFEAMAPSRPSAQDDDDYIKAIKEKRRREKAIKEGKDPDAPDAKEEPVKKDESPDSAALVNTVKQRWNSDKPADIQSVRDAFAKLAEMCAADAGARARVVKSLAGFKEQAAARALTDALRQSGVTRERLRSALSQGRGPALRAIADPKYTEADGCLLQPQVDAACQPLFEVWRDPVAFAVRNHKLDLAGPASRLDQLARMSGELASELGSWEGGHANAEALLRHLGAAQFDIKKEELTANKDVLAANEALKDPAVTDQSREHVRVLNDYRMMLGKAALRIDVALTKAAASHAKYQEKVGKLGHDMQGHPDGVTPQERCRKAGYGGGVGENCLMGAETGDAAVWQWYRAAEHHRSMIGDWIHIGAGHSGKYWVQNFGGKGR